MYINDCFNLVITTTAAVVAAVVVAAAALGTLEEKAYGQIQNLY